MQDNGFPSRGFAVAIRFLDRSVEAFTIVFVIHSVDRTLQEMVGGAHPTNVLQMYKVELGGGDPSGQNPWLITFPVDKAIRYSRRG